MGGQSSQEPLPISPSAWGLGWQQLRSAHLQRPSVSALAMPRQGSHSARMALPLQESFPVSLGTAQLCYILLRPWTRTWGLARYGAEWQRAELAQG